MEEGGGWSGKCKDFFWVVWGKLRWICDGNGNEGKEEKGGVSCLGRVAIILTHTHIYIYIYIY